MGKQLPPTYKLQGTEPQTVREIAQLYLQGGTKAEAPITPKTAPELAIKPSSDIVPDRVMQTTNPKTGELNYYTIPAKNAKNIIDKVDNSGGILPIDKAGNEYHITAKTPARMEELGFTHKGVADESIIPKPYTEVGKTTALAKSIETKAIEAGITKKFSKLTEYNPTTIKAQAEKASQLMV